MEGALWSLATAAIIGLWILIKRLIKGSFSLKSRLRTTVECHEIRLNTLEEADKLQTEGMFVLLQAAKNRGEINGETDDLFSRFKAHLFAQDR